MFIKFVINYILYNINIIDFNIGLDIIMKNQSIVYLDN